MTNLVANAEDIILGTFLQNNGVFQDIKEDLFLNPVNKRIYQAIRTRAHRKQPFDIVTIHNDLPDIEASRIASLTDSSFGSIESHLEVMKDSYRRYRMRSISRVASDDDLKPKEAMDQINGILSDMIFLNGGNHLPISVFLRREVDRLERRYKLKDQPGVYFSGIPSGFDRLDYMTDGYQSQELVIIHGKPSTGKTAFCIDTLRRQSKTGIPVGGFSQEMAGESWSQRMIAQESQINATKLQKGILSSRDLSLLFEAVELINDLPIYIDDTPNQNISDIVRKAHALKRERDIRILYVDHLGLIRHSNPRLTKTDRIGEITKELKELARNLKIPVVLISQENNEGEIFHSAEANQDADLQIRLINKENKSVGNPLIQVEIKKNRNGPTGMIQLRFMKSIQLFSEDTGGEL